MQRSWKVRAIVVPLGAIVFQSLSAGGELGGACVFKPRPAKAEAPVAVGSWDSHEPAPAKTERKVQVQLVSEHKEPAHAEPAPRVESHGPTPVIALPRVASPAAPQVQSPLLRNMLTNEGIVMMAQAGYTERFIVDMIHRKQTRFDVSPAGLAWLAQMGLTERIVRAMVANERKEDDTAMVAGYLSIGPEVEPPAAVKGKNPRARKTGDAERVALPVTIEAPSEYWYTRSQQVLPER